DDLAPLVAYRNDPEVARFQNWRGYSEEEVLAFIGEQARQPFAAAGEWTQIAVSLRGEGLLVGDVGLFRREEDPGCVEIGYSLARPWQGKGLAREAVAATLAVL